MDEDDRDFAMLPPIEKANAETDIHSDAWSCTPFAKVLTKFYM